MSAAATASARMPPALARLGEVLHRTLLQPEPPDIAVEMRAATIGVVRVTRSTGRIALGAATVVDLPPGALVPSMTEPNIRDAAAVGRALAGALERAGVMGGGRAALVLPDTVARVALIPSAELGGRSRKERESVLRFKIGKSVPFDAQQSQATAVPATATHSLVGAIHAPVLAGYEEICRATGLEPGLVELSALALLRSAAPALGTGDGLVVNWDEGYVTLVLVRAGQPILVRNLSEAMIQSVGDVAQQVSHTLLYHRERLGGTGLGVAFVRSAALPADAACDALAEGIGFRPQVLDPLAAIGGAPAALTAAAGAAAALLGAP